MHFTALFSAVMAAGALAAPPASSSPDKVDYIANAIAKGIDLEGPIPSDAVLIKEGHYTAKEGTKAWDWIRAQIERQPEDTTGIEKRDEWANIGIGMFTQDWCKGEAAWFDNVRYFVHHYGNGQYFSVGISYRGIRNNEHLDFSKLQGNDFCGKYAYSAGRNTGVGCFNSQNINCFELRHD